MGPDGSVWNHLQTRSAWTVTGDRDMNQQQCSLDKVAEHSYCQVWSFWKITGSSPAARTNMVFHYLPLSKKKIYDENKKWSITTHEVPGLSFLLLCAVTTGWETSLVWANRSNRQRQWKSQKAVKKHAKRAIQNWKRGITVFSKPSFHTDLFHYLPLTISYKWSGTL